MKSVQYVHAGWQLLGTAAGADAPLPDQNNCDEHSSGQSDSADKWKNAIVPGTVAQSLSTKIGAVENFDAKDWWYRCKFTASPASKGAEQRLRFEGLATLCDVWLNGELILSTRNMFVPHQCKVDHLLKSENELLLRFRSLDAELAVRKPRPRWRTGLVTQQNLRWVRTTLLGRIPGWTPPISPVGPWKNISLETIEQFDLENLDLQTEVRGSSKNPTKHVKTSARLKSISGKTIQSASLHVGENKLPLSVKTEQGFIIISGDSEIKNAALWWPHTHGKQNLLACKIEIKSENDSVLIDCGNVGFKSIRVDREKGKVQFVINDVPVFCRGACWTVDDFLSLTGNFESLRKSLTLAQEAGFNMLRIGGTMVYESDEFYRLCDELGILVWQDLMFANMDYPVADPEFRKEIEQEASHHMARLQKHVSVAVYCGNSEIQQQASMMGRPREEWSNDFFDQTLPKLCGQLHSQVPYFPSSPCEGALPFHVGEGLTHYYGVGAYRRPLKDVKSAQVKFTPECLGFSNVPENETIELLGGGSMTPPHHPLWKARVPRDSGAGWDFEDIRDYYLKELFGLDPVTLRSQDLERYYAISRSVSGEIMKSVFSEWRKPGSVCGGGLIWFFKDLWPGAGWGILDSLNGPKAVYHYLRRVCAPQALLLTDEGLDGLHLHVINESEKPLHALAGFEAFNHGTVKIAHAEKAVELPARGAETLVADEMLGYFADLTYSYRFGPPKHDVVRAYLKDASTGEIISEDFFFPSGLNLVQQNSDLIQATASSTGADIEVTLNSRCFLQSVHFSVKGYVPSDDYFHLAPLVERKIRFKANVKNPAPFKAELTALNLRESLTVRVKTP